jgi:hypothetical protein
VPAIIVFSLAPHGKWGLIAGSLILLVTVGVILGGLKVAVRGGPNHKIRTQRGAILEWSLYFFASHCPWPGMDLRADRHVMKEGRSALAQGCIPTILARTRTSAENQVNQ